MNAGTRSTCNSRLLYPPGVSEASLRIPQLLPPPALFSDSSRRWCCLDQDWHGWAYFEAAFASFLLLEIAFRMHLLKCRNFWCGIERYWNFFAARPETSL